MIKIKSKAQQELDRTLILRYLTECGLQHVEPIGIIVYMDDILRPVSAEGMDFHLRYMRDRRWVEMETEKAVGSPEVIRSVRITADGVDESDRRQKALAGPRVGS
jgi:hypothetical protein